MRGKEKYKRRVFYENILFFLRIGYICRVFCLVGFFLFWWCYIFGLMGFFVG